MAYVMADAFSAKAIADGKAKTFFSLSTDPAPTAEGVGDYWYQPDTKKLIRWNGTGWNDTVANLVENTSELTDDAELGKKAEWDQVTGGNKPDDNATNTTGTSDLTDDAGLGNTANWPDVTGVGKPADNATNNTGALADLNTVDTAEIVDSAVTVTEFSRHAYAATPTTSVTINDVPQGV